MNTIPSEKELQTSSEYQYQSSGLNETPVRVIFEGRVHRVPGGWKDWVPPVHRYRPQGTWELKGLSPASPQGLPGGWKDWFPPVHRVSGGLQGQSRQSPGYLGTETTWVPPVPRVPGGRNDLSPASPQSSWGLKGLSPPVHRVPRGRKR